ncbi:MAG: hypothetical protein IPJ62_10005 [Betaproteobacteria bacterium]|nr:hypothetical protein [Betaproteobacteria bacterium]
MRSFPDQVVTNAALSAVVLPVTGGLNDTYGPAAHGNPAAKVYLLAADTDIDVVYAATGSRGLALRLRLLAQHHQQSRSPR